MSIGQKEEETFCYFRYYLISYTDAPFLVIHGQKLHWFFKKICNPSSEEIPNPQLIFLHKQMNNKTKV